VDADQIIEHLGLEPHPEGGFFRETWRHDPGDGSRGAGTAVYFLLKPGTVGRTLSDARARLAHDLGGDR
jgi:predicted cupin superfamily sugar epimerase